MTMAHHRRARLAVAAFAPLALLALTACGGGGDGDDTALAQTTQPETTEPAGTPPCAESRHSVVIDFAGFMTDGDESAMWPDWINGAAAPTVRPGTVELSHAYVERGYEIIYVTTAPAGITIEGLPVPEAAQEWIRSNGFAWDDAVTRVIGYNGTNPEGSAAVLSITSELVRLSTGEGVSHDVGYTNNADKAHAMTSGGVPVQRLYMIGEEAGREGTTAVPNDDVATHMAQVVEPLPPVCTPG
jgi:hypothetical protein